MEHFFSPNSSTDLRSDAHQSHNIGGDADKDHTQIVGGYTVKLLGDISPIPPGFWHPWSATTNSQLHNFVCNESKKSKKKEVEKVEAPNSSKNDIADYHEERKFSIEKMFE